MGVSSLVHFENSVFIMGIDQLQGGFWRNVGAIDFTGTGKFFWIFAYSFAMPLNIDGFLNQLCRV